MSRTIALLALAVLAIGASAQETKLVSSISNDDGTTSYTVDWQAVGGRYDDVEANCGDSVTFKWEGADNNVGISKNGGDCDVVSNVTEVSADGEATFVLDDKLTPIVEHGEIYFTSTVGDQCKEGQLIEFYVDCSANGNAAAGGSAGLLGAAALAGAGALLLAL